jgi:hypothetical protein
VTPQDQTAQELTVNFLVRHARKVYNGVVTTGEVVRAVQKGSPDIDSADIFKAIRKSGPVGEEDLAWLDAAKSGNL